jgi:hypothetical protein
LTRRLSPRLRRGPITATPETPGRPVKAKGKRQKEQVRKNLTLLYFFVLLLPFAFFLLP